MIGARNQFIRQEIGPSLGQFIACLHRNSVVVIPVEQQDRRGQLIDRLEVRHVIKLDVETLLRDKSRRGCDKSGYVHLGGRLVNPP